MRELVVGRGGGGCELTDEMTQNEESLEKVPTRMVPLPVFFDFRQLDSDNLQK